MKNEYTEQDCIRDTQEHIDQVRLAMFRVIKELTNRAINHDKSKLESPELEVFVEYTQLLAEMTYGSPEYFSALEGMKPALDHHYSINRHHPEHFPNGVQDMTLIDVLEMYCDWKAASMRHNDGDFKASIEYNQKRFNMSDELTQIFLNTMEIFKQTEEMSENE